jgi:hypothetical protein
MENRSHQMCARIKEKKGCACIVEIQGIVQQVAQGNLKQYHER